jgi:hypothetical protein
MLQLWEKRPIEHELKGVRAYRGNPSNRITVWKTRSYEKASRSIRELQHALTPQASADSTQ